MQVNSAYEILGDEKKRAALTGVRSMRKANRVSMGLRDLARRGGVLAAGPRLAARGFQHFEFNFGGAQPGGAAEGLNAGGTPKPSVRGGNRRAPAWRVAPPGRRPAAKM